jgi:hypothetical protein
MQAVIAATAPADTATANSSHHDEVPLNATDLGQLVHWESDLSDLSDLSDRRAARHAAATWLLREAAPEWYR